MSSALASWNEADEAIAFEAMIVCCGARRWAAKMVSLRPIRNIAELSAEADRVWSTMEEADWMEAFACHPRIGVLTASNSNARSGTWSRQEQASTASASGSVLSELAAENALYEQRFGFTYIVCAIGKSADEMLGILNRRLNSDRATELREAAEQQRQILQIRLGKWLVS
jgi:OHCU decarboxylase